MFLIAFAEICRTAYKRADPNWIIAKEELDRSMELVNSKDEHYRQLFQRVDGLRHALSQVRFEITLESIRVYNCAYQLTADIDAILRRHATIRAEHKKLMRMEMSPHYVGDVYSRLRTMHVLATMGATNLVHLMGAIENQAGAIPLNLCVGVYHGYSYPDPLEQYKKFIDKESVSKKWIGINPMMRGGFRAGETPVIASPGHTPSQA